MNCKYVAQFLMIVGSLLQFAPKVKVNNAEYRFLSRDHCEI